MVYRTKGDCWSLVVTTMILPAAGLVCLVLGEAGLGWGLLTVGLLVALIFATILYLWAWPVEYDPGASGADGEPILFVRCGRRLRYSIPLAEIREVRPSAELGSSPASWSYDRLKVVYRTGSINRSLLISPRDRGGFLDELARRAKHLERDGDSLVNNIAIHGSPIEPASV
jgi:Bacterial PH domain